MLTKFKKIFFGLSAIFSVSMVHYFGFIGDIPIHFLNAIPTTISIDFASVFIFYVALAYAASKAASIFFGSVAMILLSMALRFFHTYSPSGNFKFSKIYIRLHRSESLVFILIQAFIFYILFTSLYLNFSITNLTEFQIQIAGFILFAGILRIPTLFLSPTAFINRLHGRRRHSIYSNLWTNALIIAAFLTLPASFLVGSERMKYLKKLPQVHFKNSQFSGNINILIKSKDSVIGIDGSNNYIYIDNNQIIASEQIKNPK